MVFEWMLLLLQARWIQFITFSRIVLIQMEMIYMMTLN